ncbi:hypothetical protein J6590_070316 [Homalodisca vitripennis]|nr:hypothetical protein J6590_070316 [Homalodisca vitripennis]
MVLRHVHSALQQSPIEFVNLYTNIASADVSLRTAKLVNNAATDSYRLEDVKQYRSGYTRMQRSIQLRSRPEKKNKGSRNGTLTYQFDSARFCTTLALVPVAFEL